MIAKFTRMHVNCLVLDPSMPSPVIILEDRQYGWLMPIHIGIFEAHSIATKLYDLEPPRPLTHDLFCNMLQNMKAKIARIEVTDMVDSTYVARIHLRSQGNDLKLDSRPSDAIALALRMNSPIYVADKVLEHSKMDAEEQERIKTLYLDPQEEKDLSEKDLSEEERWNRMLSRLRMPKNPKHIN